jgi:hypothetical protein
MYDIEGHLIAFFLGMIAMVWFYFASRSTRR